MLVTLKEQGAAESAYSQWFEDVGNHLTRGLAACNCSKGVRMMSRPQHNGRRCRICSTLSSKETTSFGGFLLAPAILIVSENIRGDLEERCGRVFDERVKISSQEYTEGKFVVLLSKGAGEQSFDE